MVMQQRDDESNYPLDPFHPLSSADLLLLKSNKILQGILDQLRSGNRGSPGPGQPSGPPSAVNMPYGLVNMKAELKAGQILPYEVRSFDMTNAQTDLFVDVDGFYVIADSDGSMSGVSIRFNNKDVQSPITGSPFQFFNWQMPFFGMYLSWPAQLGKTLYVAIGRYPEVKPELRSSQSKTLTPGNQTIYNAMPAGIGTEFSTMVDFTTGKRMTIYIISTLDVACSIQVTGNISNAPLTATDIDGLVNVAIGNVATQYETANLAFDDWQPWIGVKVITAAAPAVGTVLVVAVIQN